MCPILKYNLKVHKRSQAASNNILTKNIQIYNIKSQLTLKKIPNLLSLNRRCQSPIRLTIKTLFTQKL